MKRWDITSYEEDSLWNRSSSDEVGTVGGKRLFETINHTGGTGLDIYETHLWYLENGSIVEAWRGNLLETASVPGDQLFQTFGSYQLAGQEGNPLLYYWQTRQELDPETMQPLPVAPVTIVEILSFENGAFLAKPSR